MLHIVVPEQNHVAGRSLGTDLQTGMSQRVHHDVIV